MWFALRRRAATRLCLRHSWPSTRLASASAPDAALEALPSVFIQTPPFWVRHAWPLIIGNAVLLASAIDITWNHWSRLVEDLEAVGERNRQIAAAAEAKRKIDTSALDATAFEAETTDAPDDTLMAESSPSTPSTLPISPPATTADTSKKEDSSHIWERRPTWQRAGFCGVYVAGWAFSTAYLLKYRQTYVTGVKIFRGPSSLKSLSPPTPVPVPPPNTVSPPPPPPTNPTRGSAAITSPTKGSQDNRFIHIQTASKPKGLTIPLTKLSLYEGRNETELVIRSNVADATKSRWNRTGREYWFMSLSDAVVDGTRFGKVENARERILQAWFGYVDVKQQQKKKTKGKKGGSP